VKLLDILNSADAVTRWREIREEVHAWRDGAITPEQFDALQSAYKAVMDTIESSVPPELLEAFRAAREQDYRRLIVREALVREHMSMEKLRAVTEREIAAGRMTSDHELRKLAEMGAFAPHYSHADLVSGAPEQAKRESDTKGWWQFWK
jgi:uncharacterized phage-associated protein